MKSGCPTSRVFRKWPAMQPTPLTRTVQRLYVEFIRWYDSSMKEKTSITLSRDVLTGIDRVAGSKQSRSAYIEAVLAEHLRARARAQRDARDVAIINRHAEQLNRDAMDGLDDQAPLGEYPEE